MFIHLNDKAALPKCWKSGIFAQFAKCNAKFTVRNAEYAMLFVSAER